MNKTEKEQKVGIVAYGVHIPRYRIKSSTIAEIWNQNPKIVQCICNIISPYLQLKACHAIMTSSLA